FTETAPTVPADTRVALSDPPSATPSFPPDEPGDYLVSLRVRDSVGGEWAPVLLTIPVFDCTPTPIVFNASDTVVTVTDPQEPAPLFIDSNGRPLPNVGGLLRLTPHAGVSGYCGLIPTGPLTFSWAITQRPHGSEAALDSATAASPTIPQTTLFCGLRRAGTLCTTLACSSVERFSRRIRSRISPSAAATSCQCPGRCSFQRPDRASLRGCSPAATRRRCPPLQGH